MPFVPSCHPLRDLRTTEVQGRRAGRGLLVRLRDDPLHVSGDQRLDQLPSLLHVRGHDYVRLQD